MPNIPALQVTQPSINADLNGGTDIDLRSLVPIISPADTDGYLILRPDMKDLNIDAIKFVSEMQRKAYMSQALRIMLEPYEEALICSGTSPSWSERRNRLSRENDWLAGSMHVVAIARDKGGTTAMTINKRLPNGRDNEPFSFTYLYGSDAELINISIKFPASEMELYFANGEISTIGLTLGTTRNGVESSLALLKIHGLSNSALYRYVSTVPRGGASEEFKRGNKSTLVISPRDLTLKLTNFYTKPSVKHENEWFYSEDLAYSAQENKFVPKDGTNGLSIEEFLTITRNVLELLPFARIGA